MSKDQRQYPRTPVNEPVAVAAGDRVYDGVLKDISKGGAAVEFCFPSATERARFDIGSRVALSPEAGATQSGRVVREYVNGIGVRFDILHEKG
jgi:hypothetical protein